MMLGIFVIFVIPFTFITVYNYQATKSELFDHALAESVSAARILAINLALQNTAEIGSMLAAIKIERKNVKLISIISKEKKITHSSEPAKIGETVQGAEYLLALNDNRTFTKQYDKEVRMLIPVSSGVNEKGVDVSAVIEQITSLEAEIASLLNNLLRFIIYGAIILSAIMMMVFYMAGRITNPVHDLAIALKKFEEGDYKVMIDREATGELGSLIDSFNRMVRSRREYNAAIERFIPKDFLNFLGKSDFSTVSLGDAIKRDFTILFTDMRSYTSLSEGFAPDQLLAFVNGYLKRIAPIIRRHEGFIITYLGDAIMAAFPESADDALLCSMDIHKELDQINRERAARGEVAISIGVGVNSGTSMLGVMGAEDRLEAAVLSDVVNLTARLESLTKHYGCKTIFSKAALERIYNPDEEAYSYRFLDTVRVKGKNTPVTMYELITGSDPVSRLKKQFKEDYEMALGQFLAGNIKEAYSAFKALKEKNPDDGVLTIMLKRCKSLFEVDQNRRVIGVKLPPNWDGVTTLESK